MKKITMYVFTALKMYFNKSQILLDGDRLRKTVILQIYSASEYA